mgnify:CR=1 FL=1
MTTTAQAMLDAVQAAILAKMTGGAVQEYDVGGQSIKYMSLKDLESYETKLLRRVAATKDRTSFSTFQKPI